MDIHILEGGMMSGHMVESHMVEEHVVECHMVEGHKVEGRLAPDCENIVGPGEEVGVCGSVGQPQGHQ